MKTITLYKIKARTFITTGDEIHLSNICTKFGGRLEIGGPPNEHTHALESLERKAEDHAGSKGTGRTDWMIAYILVNKEYQLRGIISHFKHYLSTL